MAFVPKDWRNATTYAGGGDESTPVTAESLEDLETRVTDYADEASAPTFNVKAYGAEGDGVTNDTAAIQDAIDDANALGAGNLRGGNVVFPKGQYLCHGLSLDDTMGVSLIGIGDARQHGPELLSSSTGSTPMITASSASGFRISGLRIENDQAAYTGIVMLFDSEPADTDTSLGVIENCYIRGYIQAGSAVNLMTLNNSFGIEIRQCRFVGGKRAIWGRYDTSSFSNTQTIRDCFFELQDTTAIQEPDQMWRIENNTFEPLRTGAGRAVTNAPSVPCRGPCVFSGNLTGDITELSDWIVWGGGECMLLVIGNYFLNQGEPGGTGIYLTAAAKNIALIGNDFLDVGLGVQTDGNACTNFTSIGNKYRTTGGALTTTPFNGALLTVASAATMTLPDENDLTVLISGTTTITSITAAPAGRRVTLLFTSTAQVTDGSNLKLSANSTGAADRTLTLASNGTNWYEVARSAN